MTVREWFARFMEGLRPARAEVRGQRERNRGAIMHYEALNRDLEELHKSLRARAPGGEQERGS